MSEKDIFGERLRRRRMALGWSQTTLADRLSVRPATISRYESGTYGSVTFARLRQLADVLATSTDYLLGRVEDPGPVPHTLCTGRGAAVDGMPLSQTLTPEKEHEYV